MPSSPSSSPGKWPKTPPPLSEEQERIREDFMKYWHEVLPRRYAAVERFNHGYPVKHAPPDAVRTLEIGAGLGEHLEHERLTPAQLAGWVALELRPGMAAEIARRHPGIQVHVGDVQAPLPFPDGHFDRILAVHVLEHLPDLPAAVRELRRVCSSRGVFQAVIPCVGGFAYALGQRVSSGRMFEKRYGQPYRWFIDREHVNAPAEIFEELAPHFAIGHRAFFPLAVPSVELNFCIGFTARPRCDEPPARTRP